ncbi:carboxylating nicotinate-nucleotide diphosphorylase [Bosea caraganae]|uniref:Probable nicotinate-nucleotide pyrophosphorylase [carboxylating] n=1 Tax=Bosea caraganae TaxID=2763117 RepID=A0A370KZW2_9HYPH|nr:carboxylating nicotinate-nucleotide diphosphorylase [Bosea caraganae]RDJ20507.1 carboxylating nicotinate-nucleotide diphosphorylase [Bosea caraganae]RDJ30023.1 carboxylating nicotinate-nucleotide diphosphorylase [Bosea caraganae]
MSQPVLNALLITDAVRAALIEDLGRAGDITTLATIPAGRQARLVIASRQNGVVAGLPFAREAFRQIDPSLRFEAMLSDGDRLVPGTIVARVEGEARSILSAERVALNFMGRLCGIASLAATYVAKVAGTKAVIVDTRKTTPGLRAFEKYAVRCGGAQNHRFGLDDAILIKDNHVAVAGGIRPALQAAKRVAGNFVKVEIEVDTLAQLEEVLTEGADIVMLDNMSIADLTRGVAMVAGRMKVEASGGINLDTVAAVAATGVDMISVGALTHSVGVLDLGLDIEIT